MYWLIHTMDNKNQFLLDHGLIGKLFKSLVDPMDGWIVDILL